MSTCGDPGPGAAHCTDYAGHRYSCHDASADVSWNDGMEGLAPHECDNATCPANPPPAPTAEGARP